MENKPAKQHRPPSAAPTLDGQDAATKSNAIEIPQISLPKGGGALKGIDEKFQVNPSNGTASFSIPLPLSPNRNGFTPSLSVSYNSGAGNSILGIGWALDLPSIQRKTDRQLPRYRDFSEEEDVFMFSGAEDMVPMLESKQGAWEKVTQPPEDTGGYLVQRYRPRTEGSFSRIERIYHPDHSLYWRVMTRDNVTTIFGRSPDCRIADPENPDHIFEWLPELSFDDKGSVVTFEYLKEAAPGLTPKIYDRNRIAHNGHLPYTNLYLKRVKYGNVAAFYPNENTVFPFDPLAPPDNWHFELVLDYGDHHPDIPALIPDRACFPRPDPFSTYRAGFEIRTRCLLKRVLMFHCFPTLNNGAQTLVRSLDFQHFTSDSDHSTRETDLKFLESITQTGYRWLRDEECYAKKSLPPIQLEYQPLHWNHEIKAVQQEDLVHAPTGLSGNYQWVDLYNEGIAGILTEQGNGWHYKHNLGDTKEDGLVRFTPAKLVMPKPSFSGLAGGVLQLQDLDGDGGRQIVVNGDGVEGYFELSEDGWPKVADHWLSFRAFLKTTNVDLRDPNVRLFDLNGDGKPEIVLTEENAFCWWAGKGRLGYDSPERTFKSFDEEQGPAIVFSDPEQRIFLADMSGDGLVDIVRIRNGEVCYWPNLGYGRFGCKVTMSHAPWFDAPGQFDPAYLQLADISGTGASDLVYLGQNKFRAWLNLSGNAWSKQAEEIEPFFRVSAPGQVTITDLLGQGTGCLVWSSALPGDAPSPLRYIDLMGGKKPHIMTTRRNSMGQETVIEYKSSTWYYLQDKRNGKPWVTKLPFPVQVVSRVLISDTVTGARFVNRYTYHHGYYDHTEREFRGFGRVDQYDTEDYENWLSLEAANTVHRDEHEPPVLTRTWFHTGAFLRNDQILEQFEREYWYHAWNAAHPESPVQEHGLPEAHLDTGVLEEQTLTTEEYREALRACKGMTLRQEVFALDGSAREALPYTVATHNCHIRLVQPRAGNRYASFLALESEAITWNYERDPADVRVGHTFNLRVDELGNILQAVTVVYPRRAGRQSTLPEYQYDYLHDRPASDPERVRLADMHAQHQILLNHEQQRLHLILTESDYTNDVLANNTHRLRLPYAVRSFELKGVGLAENAYFSLETLQNAVETAVETPYENREEPPPPLRVKRLIEHIQTRYRSDDTAEALPFRALESLALPWEAYQLAFTPTLLDELYGDKLPATARPQILETEGKYERRDGVNWWISSGKPLFPADARARFYLPEGYEDPFESRTRVEFDPHFLLVQKSIAAPDTPLALETEVLRFNYRTLAPELIRDTNDNLAEASSDELGMVVATAVYSKPNAAGQVEGDRLEGGNWAFDQVRIEAFFNDPQGQAADLLGTATTCLVYDFGKIPVRVAAIAREKHLHQLAPGDLSPLQISIEYSDGMGQVALKKVQAEPGDAPCRDAQGQLEKNADGTLRQCLAAFRWIGNERTVLNNKGKPVRQYEPYFSSTHAYENEAELRETGVSPHLYYDAIGRPERTVLPNGTFSRVRFTAWEQWDYDPNDTIGERQADGRLQNPCPWYAARIAGALGTTEQAAAQKAAVHADTPTVTYFDSLGRPFYSVAHNRWWKQVGNDRVLVEEKLPTYVELDVEGNVHQMMDARDNAVMRWQYDMLGHRVYQFGMDNGKRWMLNDCMSKPVMAWDENGIQNDDGSIRNHELRVLTIVYDPLHRPTDTFLELNGQSYLIEHLEYDTAENGKGQASLHRDGSGQMTNVRFDFKGNLLETQKRIPVDAKVPIVDWQNAQLEHNTYQLITEYDALNRMSKLYNWHRNLSDAVVYEPTYSERGVLSSETITINGKPTLAVSGIEYDAKGQRTRMRQNEGKTTTTYQYDEKTFRLLQLRTTRHNPPVSTLKSGLKDNSVLQELNYTYDPVGNITEIYDEAYEIVYFNNERIEPQCKYEYDALYRLIKATGKENVTNQAPQNKDPEPVNFGTAALRNYTQTFKYDAVGNILKVKHSAGVATTVLQWTRNYQYAKDSNRLLATQEGSSLEYDTYTDTPTLETKYRYDLHGNMLNLHHTTQNHITWDYRDMIQQYNLQGGGRAYYQYGNDKQRSRKVIEKAGSIKEERLYLGGMERYRRWRNGNPNPEEEIETFHVFEGEQRILMVENVITTNNNNLDRGLLYRYQYSNHLGSATLELNEAAEIVSYEEYHPYGTTAYSAQNAAVKCVAKRYRYTGMERDEETGLAYHSARYYLPWLGRWGSCDPIGVKAGMNLYSYAYGNCIKFIDKSGKDNTEFLPGSITDYPHLGQIWNEARNRVLERRFGQGSEAANMEKFRENLSELEGSARTEYARNIFDSVRSRFYRVVSGYYRRGMQILGDIPLSAEQITAMSRGSAPEGVHVQAHHGAPSHLAENPGNSLNPESIGLRTGHATEEGGSHYEQHAAERLHEAQSIRPGLYPYGEFPPEDPRHIPQQGSSQQNPQTAPPASEDVNVEPETAPIPSESNGSSNGVSRWTSVGGIVLHLTGRLLTGMAIIDSFDRVEIAVRRGNTGNTSRVIAHETSGWLGAIAVGEAVLPYGLACGPAAEVCVPVLGLVGGAIGFFGSSWLADRITGVQN